MGDDTFHAQLTEMRRKQEWFTREAEAGRVQYEVGMGKEFAANYQGAIDEFKTKREALKDGLNHDGFGSFASCVELRDGFRQHARDAYNACSEYIEICYRLQAAHLRADNDYHGRDEANKQALEQSKKRI